MIFQGVSHRVVSRSSSAWSASTWSTWEFPTKSAPSKQNIGYKFHCDISFADWQSLPRSMMMCLLCVPYNRRLSLLSPEYEIPSQKISYHLMKLCLEASSTNRRVSTGKCTSHRWKTTVVSSRVKPYLSNSTHQILYISSCFCIVCHRTNNHYVMYGAPDSFDVRICSPRHSDSEVFSWFEKNSTGCSYYTLHVLLKEFSHTFYDSWVY